MCILPMQTSCVPSLFFRVRNAEMVSSELVTPSGRIGSVVQNVFFQEDRWLLQKLVSQQGALSLNLYSDHDISRYSPVNGWTR